MMKLMLTSGGVTSAAIRNALVETLGKPVEECSALAIPSASYGHVDCTPGNAWNFLTGRTPGPVCDLGWKSIGVLEPSVLESLGEERWRPWVENVDAILVDGGDPAFLAYWLQRSGLAKLLPELDTTTWVGVSAGSMVMTPYVGMDFVTWTPPGQDQRASDAALGLVDFHIFPHLDVFPTNTMARATAWASHMTLPTYALDDRSAVRVVDGEIDVVSDGTWELFAGG